MSARRKTMEHSILLVACRFQRTKKAAWEKGVAAGRDGNVDIILDEFSKPVKTIWNYHLEHIRLSVQVEV